jgi:acetylornithine deacetylase
MPDELQARLRATIAGRRDEILQTILDVVGVSSVTNNEAGVQDGFETAMRKRDLAIDRWVATEDEIAPYTLHVGEQDVYENRPNLVGRRAGSPGTGGKSIMLQGHVDTVDPGDPSLWTRNPAGEYVAAEDRIYGRGALDMKAGVVTAIFVLQALDDLGIRLNGDVLVAATVGEEDGGLGALSTILRGYKTDGVVITEPTSRNLVIAQGGSLVFRLTVTGRSAHGATRHQGVSALEKFVPIFQDLLAWEAERTATLRHPLFDHLEDKFPISVGVVKAGTWASTVPEILVAEGRLGFLPAESIEEMQAATIARIAAVANQDDWLRDHPPLVEWFGGQFDSAEVSPDEPIAQAVARAHERSNGSPVTIAAMSAGLDLRLFTQIGHMPTVTYGAGSVQEGHAHGPDEWIQLDEILLAVEALTLTVIDWCGIASD